MTRRGDTSKDTEETENLSVPDFNREAMEAIEAASSVATLPSAPVPERYQGIEGVAGIEGFASDKGEASMSRFTIRDNPAVPHPDLPRRVFYQRDVAVPVARIPRATRNEVALLGSLIDVYKKASPDQLVPLLSQHRETVLQAVGELLDTQVVLDQIIPLLEEIAQVSGGSFQSPLADINADARAVLDALSGLCTAPPPIRS